MLVIIWSLTPASINAKMDELIMYVLGCVCLVITLGKLGGRLPQISFRNARGRGQNGALTKPRRPQPWL